MKRILATTAAIIGLLGFAMPADAGSTNTTLTTTTSISNACTATGGTISLGNYTQALIQDAATVLTVNCTLGDSSVVISLDNGANYSAPNRQLSDGAGHFLTYNFYTSATYATIWNTTNTNSYTGTGANQSITTWVQVPANQNEPSGTYSDQVNVTVNY